MNLADEPGTSALLSYRSDAFSRAKQKNREKVDAAVAEGKLRVLLKSRVEEITRTHVRIEADGGIESIENDAVIVCAGGVLPTGFLESIGVEFETKRGTAWQKECG
jgi:thioredoxin reductase